MTVTPSRRSGRFLTPLTLPAPPSPARRRRSAPKDSTAPIPRDHRPPPTDGAERHRDGAGPLTHARARADAGKGHPPARPASDVGGKESRRAPRPLTPQSWRFRLDAGTRTVRTGAAAGRALAPDRSGGPRRAPVRGLRGLRSVIRLGYCLEGPASPWPGRGGRGVSVHRSVPSATHATWWHPACGTPRPVRHRPGLCGCTALWTRLPGRSAHVDMSVLPRARHLPAVRSVLGLHLNLRSPGQRAAHRAVGDHRAQRDQPLGGQGRARAVTDSAATRAGRSSAMRKPTRTVGPSRQRPWRSRYRPVWCAAQEATDATDSSGGTRAASRWSR